LICATVASSGTSTAKRVWLMVLNVNCICPQFDPSSATAECVLARLLGARASLNTPFSPHFLTLSLSPRTLPLTSSLLAPGVSLALACTACRRSPAAAWHFSACFHSCSGVPRFAERTHHRDIAPPASDALRSCVVTF
jgi:hypothetical protein